jgi:hypothetical protein
LREEFCDIVSLAERDGYSIVCEIRCKKGRVFRLGCRYLAYIQIPEGELVVRQRRVWGKRTSGRCEGREGVQGQDGIGKGGSDSGGRPHPSLPLEWICRCSTMDVIGRRNGSATL